MNNTEIDNTLNNIFLITNVIIDEAESEIRKIQEFAVKSLNGVDIYVDALKEEKEINGIVHLCLTGK
jgi:hypothetical protein